MRIQPWFAVALSLIAAASAQAGTAADRYGAAITEKKPTPIAKVAKDPAGFVGKTVRIEGTIKEACQTRGCWVEIAGPAGVTFLARSLDETVLVPKDVAGRRIVVQGEVVSRPAEGHDHAKEEAAHGHSHGQGGGHGVEAGHKCPAPTYLLATQGIEIKPGKPKK